MKAARVLYFCVICNEYKQSWLHDQTGKRSKGTSGVTESLLVKVFWGVAQL